MANLMVVPGGNFLEAGKIFEIEAATAASEKLLKYSAKCEYLLSKFIIFQLLERYIRIMGYFKMCPARS